jgi:major membrane immunogen (membrane-anchored lipoprotein)
MKKRLLTTLLCLTLLLPSCASSKSLSNEKLEPKQEVLSGEKDPLMKLLVSGLVIYILHSVLR